MTGDNFNKAVERAFGRADDVLTAIETDGNVQDTINKMNEAAPWDLVAIGRGFVQDYITEERVEDGRLTGE